MLSLKEQLEEQLKRTQEKKSTDQSTEQLPLLEKPEEEQELQEKDSESGEGELKIPKLSHAEVKAILGEHENVESFAAAKYEEYMRVAADFMKNNRYYRAADSYALAEVFKSNDPSALIGRGYALFAAGEFREADATLKLSGKGVSTILANTISFTSGSSIDMTGLSVSHGTCTPVKASSITNAGLALTAESKAAGWTLEVSGSQTRATLAP